MRITVQSTGETLEVATGKRGNKDDQRKGNDLICRVVKPRFSPQARRRAAEFRKEQAAHA